MPLRKQGQSYHDPFQKRAMEALELALLLKKQNAHVFLCGSPGHGRKHILKSWLESRAKKMAIPDDLLFLPNFEDVDRPKLVSLPAGDGKKFAVLLKDFLESLYTLIKEKFTSSAYAAKKDKLHSSYHKSRTRLLNRMANQAKEDGFEMEMDPDGEIRFYPSETVKKKPVSGKKKNDFSRFARDLEKIEEEFVREGQSLDKLAIEEVISESFKKLRDETAQKFNHPVLANHIIRLVEDLEKNYPEFLLAWFSREDENFQKQMPFPLDFLRGYGVNVFVDNSSLAGMPVIFEDNPTYDNLLGCMEREAEMGSLVTNFSLIRSGSLHKANGGFLILNINDLLARPSSFDGLLRALDNGFHRLEDTPDEFEAHLRTKSPRPESVAINATVILVGDEDDYEWLLDTDEKFARLFRIKAHLARDVERTAKNTRQYLLQVGQMIRDNGLLPFNAEALSRIVELGSCLCEDRTRISLHYSALKDYLVEASSLAMQKGAPLVTAEILDKAWERKILRNNLLEKEYLEYYERQIVRIETTGKAIGKINALTVVRDGEFEFGLPSTISCAVGVGHDGIIDLERDVEMGGPIHSKAMMILKNYLISHFANKNPIILSGSLYFEQNYVGVEGDSASGAELAVIISAIAKIPLRQDLAFTGSVNQNGDILAIGGATAKIEGFYKVCRSRGLSGTQGVIIPAANIENLFLSRDILSEIESGNFFIYPVRNIEEALALLSGLPVGKARKNFSYTPGSLFAKVDERLQALGAAYQHPFKGVKNH